MLVHAANSYFEPTWIYFDEIGCIYFIFEFPCLTLLGEFISQIKFTVLILPSETKRLNSHALPYISSEHKMEDPAINAIMQQGTKRVKKSKKKGKKKAEPAKEGEAKPAETQPMETGK